MSKGKGFTNDAIPALSVCESPIEGKFVQAFFDSVRDVTGFEYSESDSAKLCVSCRIVFLDEQESVPVAVRLEIQKRITDAYSGHSYRFDFFLGLQKLGTFAMAGLFIELDGKAFHSSNEQIARDIAKDRAAARNGGPCIHFTGSEVYQDPLGTVKEAMHAGISLLKRAAIWIDFATLHLTATEELTESQESP